MEANKDRNRQQAGYQTGIGPAPDSVDAGARVSELGGRGRPKLGAVSREVTLLPRHWEWLTAQPGGASVALRKLVAAWPEDVRDHAIELAFGDGHDASPTTR